MLSKEMPQIKHIIIHIILPLVVGALIYILFRSNTLLIFKWLEYININDTIHVVRNHTVLLCKYIPDFLLYSLPDGIWVYSATSALLLIWEHTLYKHLWIYLPVTSAVAAEILQSTGLIAGTFCMFDIIAYITGLILSCIIINKRRKEE